VAISNSEMALPGQLEKQFVLRFLGLGYTMILELVIMSQGHIKVPTAPPGYAVLNARFRSGGADCRRETYRASS
jgi:hypothetical protein